MKSLVELLKSWAKVLVIAFCTLGLFYWLKDTVLFINQEPTEQAIIHAIDLVMMSALILALSTLLVSVIDVPFQIYDFTKKMRIKIRKVNQRLRLVFEGFNTK